MRWLVFMAMVLYSVWLIFDYQYHFIDYVNLAFHEAGHLIFTPLGKTFHFLGGTIGQLFFPVVIVVYFWRNDKPFEASIGAVWFAESLMYTAYYMSDARNMLIPLAGGGVHDWNYLFGRWGVLHRAETIGAFFHVLASILLIAVLIFMLRQLNMKQAGSSDPSP